VTKVKLSSADLQNRVVPGKVLGMNQPSIAEGDLVKVVSGVYADAVGVVVDIQPECSVMRIHSKGGSIYALEGTVRHLPLPIAVELSTSKDLVRM
jgi:hypothetical protein